jgi:GNAT superfamily N-acetyltransferase
LRQVFQRANSRKTGHQAVLAVLTFPDNLQICRAHPDDKAVILGFCQHTWEDEADYIPDVLDLWINDPLGHILVAVLNNQPVGMTRLVQLSPTEGWWEGLRVDRNYRQQGIGSLLCQAAIDTAQSLGLATLRTCVSVKNTLMQTFVQHRGFIPQGDYAVYQADAIADAPSSLQAFSFADLNTIWATISHLTLDNSRLLFVPKGAKWQALTQNALAQLLTKGWVWGLGQGNAINGLFIRSQMEDPDGTLWIGWLGGTSASLGPTLEGMRCLAHQQGFKAIGGFVPQVAPLLDLMHEKGYQFADTAAYRVYELNSL